MCTKFNALHFSLVRLEIQKDTIAIYSPPIKWGIWPRGFPRYFAGQRLARPVKIRVNPRVYITDILKGFIVGVLRVPV